MKNSEMYDRGYDDYPTMLRYPTRDIHNEQDENEYLRGWYDQRRNQHASVYITDEPSGDTWMAYY